MDKNYMVSLVRYHRPERAEEILANEEFQKLAERFKQYCDELDLSMVRFYEKRVRNFILNFQ